MNIVTDSHYSMGKTHLVCQDYAWHGQEPAPSVILADGCSSSPDTDMGARLLVLNARQLLPRFLAAAGDVGRHWRLGRLIVARSLRQARALGLDDSAVDATLMVAFFKRDQVYVHLYGDGCVLARRADGSLWAMRVNYACNSPYYLSYLASPERRLCYQQAVGDSAQSVHILDDDGLAFQRRAYDHPLLLQMAVDEFQVLAVATDGVDSLIHADNGDRLDLRAVAKEFMAFANPNGAFVKRRLRRALQCYARQDIHNSDDIGFGVFVREG